MVRVEYMGGGAGGGAGTLLFWVTFKEKTQSYVTDPFSFLCSYHKAIYVDGRNY